MVRVGFRLQLRIELIEEYIEKHKEVWPEMLAELERAGWHNYSLFIDRDDGVLFGYFETPNLLSAKEQMALTEVNARWQEMMAPYFIALDGFRPDEGFKELEEIFHLA